MNQTIQTYEIVAGSWNNFRQKPFFPEWFRFLAKRWKSGIIIDLGCGNGRNMTPFSGGFDIIGIDISKNMLKNAQKFCKKRKIDARFLLSDVLYLPLKESSVKYVLSIAVYHHLPQEKLEEALSELYRILAPGGEAFITVWNRMKMRFLLRRSEQNISWRRKSDNRVFYRYYYLYTRSELRYLIKKAGFRIVLEGSEKSMQKSIFSKNICLLVKKG